MVKSATLFCCMIGITLLLNAQAEQGTLNLGADIPDGIELPAGVPVESYTVDASEWLNKGGTLSFAITPVYNSPVEAAAFLQGGEVALAFVRENGLTYLAAWSGDINESGWIFASVPDYSFMTANISLKLNSESGVYKVIINQELIYEGTLSETSENTDMLFFGEADYDVTISNINYDNTNFEEVASKPISLDTEFLGVKKLADVAFTSASKFIRDYGKLRQLSRVYSEAISELPVELVNYSLGSIIFLDNKVGDDSYTGKWPEVIGKHGPKATLKAAYEAAPENGIIVIFPGLGLYGESYYPYPDKAVNRVTVGDIVFATSDHLDDVIASLQKRLIIDQRGEDINIIKNDLESYQNLKRKYNEIYD